VKIVPMPFFSPARKTGDASVGAGEPAAPADKARAVPTRFLPISL